MNREDYYITPSLYSAYHYEDRQGFLDTLLKKPFERTPLMQKGIDFEDAIFTLYKKHTNDGTFDNKLMIEILEYMGFPTFLNWQERCLLEVDGMPLIYGKADVVNAKNGFVYDIKFCKTLSSYAEGKYQWSVQNQSYMDALGFKNSAYVICDGRDWVAEPYHMTDNMREGYLNKYRDMLNCIEGDEELKEAFTSNWKRKYKSI